MIAHYELYKSIINLPGCVIECVVFKGASLIRFTTFREIMESPYSRKIIGFDDCGTAAGETKAIDEFFNDKAIIKKPLVSHIPAYIRKQSDSQRILLSLVCSRLIKCNK